MNKNDIINLFKLTKEDQRLLSDYVGPYMLNEKREKEFIGKALIPWLAKLKKELKKRRKP